jgi:hypothetical protein
VEREPKEPTFMMSKAFSIAAAAGLLIVTTALGHAESATQRYAPSQRMQEHGSVPGQPGASGYSPGHQMQRKGSKAGEPGASGYAPGHQPSTTGRGTTGIR